MAARASATRRSVSALTCLYLKSIRQRTADPAAYGADVKYQKRYVVLRLTVRLTPG